MAESAPLVAITGASGFIGRRVVTALQPHYRLRVLLRAGREPPSESLEVVEGSLESRDALNALVGGAAAVVHCAGAVRGRRLPDFAANVGGTLSLVHVCERANPEIAFLALSSLAAREPTLSAYAATKRAGEATIIESRLNWCILRPPAVYGPGDVELAPLFDLMGAGWGIHPNVRDGRMSVLHVDDLAAAIRNWLDAAERPRGTFELSDGHPGYDWQEICALVGELLGRRVRRLPLPRWLLWSVAASNDLYSRVRGYQPMLTPGKVRELFHPDWVADPGPFMAATGWRPQITLVDGLRCHYGLEDAAGRHSAERA